MGSISRRAALLDIAGRRDRIVNQIYFTCVFAVSFTLAVAAAGTVLSPVLTDLSRSLSRIDSYAMHRLGEYGHRSQAADKFILVCVGLGSVKLLPMVASAWGLWFLEADR